MFQLALQSGRGTQAPDDAMMGKKIEMPPAMPSAAAGSAPKIKPEIAGQKMLPPSHAPRPDPKIAMMGESGMRRVKTEPSLTSLTPKEYLERKQRMRDHERLQQQEQLKARHHSHVGHETGKPHPHQRHHERPGDPHRSHRPSTSKDLTRPGIRELTRDPMRTRPDPQTARPEVPSAHAGHTEGKKSREHHRSGEPRPQSEVAPHRPPGDRDKSRMSSSHVPTGRERERSPLLSTLSHDLGGILDPIPSSIKIDPLPPPEMLMAELTKPVSVEPEKPSAEVRIPPRQTQTNTSKVATSETLSMAQHSAHQEQVHTSSNRHKHAPPEAASRHEATPPPPPPPPLVPPPPPARDASKGEAAPSSSGSGDTKLKLSIGQLKERYQSASKHSDKASPRKSKRDRSRDPPDTNSDKKDLKLKISLGSSPGVASVKREEPSRSSPSTGDLKVKLDLKSHRLSEGGSERGRSPVVGGEGSGRREYMLSNEGNPLKLKLKLGPSTSSPGPSSSRKHSSSHSAKNGSHSQNRKRPFSPQTSTSQLPHKMSRNDSLSDMANGSVSSPTVATPLPENIEDVRRQLQQLIDLQSAQLKSQADDSPGPSQ